MPHIFEIIEKTGKKVHLSQKRWKHISQNHPDVIDKLEDIQKALTNPTLIVPHKFDEAKRNYYFYYKNIKRYLLVAVKYINDEGHVSTAFIARNIKKR